MIRTITCAVMALSLLLASAEAMASGAGSRGAYSRGGWVGAHYVAMGRTGEVLCDDAYSIYWNPAGLSELRYTQVTTEKEIREKAEKGKLDDITEDDLIRFSEQEKSFSAQVGITGALLDVGRNTGFVGVAFNLPTGVLGIGGYTLVSDSIDRRDYTGVKTGSLTYAGTACYLSYGASLGVASLGFTVKGLWEKLGNTNYAGGGLDIGTQVYVLPFLKIGFVVQDLGAGLYPIEERLGVRKTYDLEYPTLRLGIALITNRNFTISVSGIKHLEQKTFSYGVGVRYDIVKYVSIFLGMQDLAFSTGVALHLKQFDLSYAFTIDSINYGYNHVISTSILF
jgi:hypothetical protein